MYKILYYVLQRLNRLMWYANALREFVPGNRQQERVKSIRDLLEVIPMKYKGMREQGQAGWAFEPHLWVCGSDTYERRKNGGLGRKSVRLQYSSETILRSPMGSSSSEIFWGVPSWAEVAKLWYSCHAQPLAGNYLDLKHCFKPQSCCSWRLLLDCTPCGSFLLKKVLTGSLAWLPQNLFSKWRLEGFNPNWWNIGKKRRGNSEESDMCPQSQTGLDWDLSSVT